jgi:hypothetical protein
LINRVGRSFRIPCIRLPAERQDTGIQKELNRSHSCSAFLRNSMGRHRITVPEVLYQAQAKLLPAF